MTNFLRDNNRRIQSSRDLHAGRRYAVAGILITVIFLFFGRHVLSAGFVSFARPLWSLEETVAGWLSPLTTGWASKIELSTENEQLTETVEEKNLEIARLKLILDEYSEIAALFTKNELEAPNGQMIRIAARPPVSPFDTLILSSGQNAGLMEKDLVYGPGGVILGEVREVYSKSAKAILYSAPGQEQQAFIDTLGPLVLTGQGNGNFVGDFPKGVNVPLDSQITKEGSVSIIAKVGTTTIDEGDALQRIYAQLPVNIQTLAWVYVIRPE